MPARQGCILVVMHQCHDMTQATKPPTQAREPATAETATGDTPLHPTVRPECATLPASRDRSAIDG